MAFSLDRLDQEYLVLLNDLPITVTFKQEVYTVNMADLNSDIRNKYPNLLKRYKLSFLASKSTFDATVKAGEKLTWNSYTYTVLAVESSIDNRLFKIHCGEDKI